MSTEILARMTGVGKNYPYVTRKKDRAKALLQILVGQTNSHYHRVLADIGLEIRRGESLGVIGENGAGKSTLLKVLTGVLKPSAGKVEVEGKVAAMLELGAGFHPEYTGRENLHLSASLQGFSRKRLQEKMDEILAFADIGDYIDEPIKHYSSGMVVRLGFALVTAQNPDLLITDEVLAVGDEAFQRKCIAWMEDYLRKGGTLLLVSHSMYHIQKICSQALWLHHGRAHAYGDVFEVTQQYLAYQESKIAAEKKDEALSRAGIQEFAMLDVRLNGETSDTKPVVLDAGEELRVDMAIGYQHESVPVAALGIVRADGTPVYGTSSELAGCKPRLAEKGKADYSIVFGKLPLLPGTYHVRAHALDAEALRVFDTMERTFVVRGKSRELGLVRLAHEWRDFDEQKAII